MENKIKVPVNGGYIIAERNPERDYDGVCVYFEDSDGILVDIAVIESRSEENYSNIHVYNYADVWSEDFTSKHILSISEIKKALEE